MKTQKRRDFFKYGLLGTLGLAAGGAIWHYPQRSLPPNKSKKDRLGVALVGLGYYSTDLLAPALQLTQHCYLAGIVTGSPWKIPIWQKKYNIPDRNVYNYQNMTQISNNPDIDVIYIVLPTGLHAKYTMLAANSGKHVWCEKPMAIQASDCEKMIRTCQKNKVNLSIGYRMQHEPNTQTIMEYAHQLPYGKIKDLEARAGYYDGRKDHWKRKKTMGGGAIYDMGVYSINATRYATGKEPIAVLAARHENKRPDIYNEVGETTFFTLEFPEGIIAKGATSLGAGFNDLKVNCEKGWYTLDPMQAYGGIRGRTSDQKQLNKYIPNQQARQMDDDALAIKTNQALLVPGEEGWRDIKIVEAINESARIGKRMEL